MQKYNPGNPFSKRLSIADAAVAWAGLREELFEYVTVTQEGWPVLMDDMSLRQRAEAIYEALQAKELKGLAFNEDGYPLQPRLCLIDKESFEVWLKKRRGEETTAAAAAELEEELLEVPAVAAFMGYAEKTLQRRRQDGLFPKEDFTEPLRWRLSTVERAKREEDARLAVHSKAKAGK